MGATDINISGTSNEVLYVKRTERDFPTLSYDEVGKPDGFNQNYSFYNICVCEIYNIADKKAIMVGKYESLTQCCVGFFVVYKNSLKYCGKCDCSDRIIENFKKFLQKSNLRTHYVNVYGQAGILNTPHVRVDNINHFNVKSKVSRNELDKLELLQIFALDYIPISTVKDKKLYRLKWTKDKIGLTPYTLADFCEAIKCRYILEVPDYRPYPSIYDYMVKYHNYVGPKPCAVYTAHHCDSCSFFCIALSNLINYIWQRSLLFAQLLIEKGICPDRLAPDDIDMIGLFVDYEFYDGKGTDRFEVCYLVFEALSSVWAHCDVNMFFKVFRCANPHLVEFSEALTYEDMLYSFNRSDVCIDYNDDDICDFEVLSYLLSYDSIDYNIVSECIFDSISKEIEYSDSSNLVNFEAINYIGMNKNIRLFLDFMKCRAGFYSYDNFKSYFGIDKLFGKNMIYNLWDRSFRSGNFYDLIELLKNVWVNYKFDSGRPSSFFIPQYDRCCRLLLETSEFILPSSYRLPVIGYVPTKLMCMCENSACVEAREKTILVSLATLDVALNYTRIRSDKSLERIIYFGNVHPGYVNAEDTDATKSYFDIKVLEMLKEHGINLSTVNSDIGDSIFLSHRYFTKRSDALEADMDLYNLCEDSSIPLMVFIAGIIHLAVLQHTEIVELKSNFPDLHNTTVLPVNQIIKNPKTSAGPVLSTLGLSETVRDVMGDSFRTLYIKYRSMYHQQVLFLGINKICLSAKVLGRTISSVNCLEGDIGRYLYGTAKVVQAANYGRKCEGPLFFKGNWHTSHLWPISIPIKRSRKVAVSYDAPKFDKSLSMDYMVGESLLNLSLLEKMGDSDIDDYHLALSEIGNNSCAAGIVKGSVIKRINGTSSGNSHTKTSNSNIAELRLFMVVYMNLLSNYSPLDVRCNKFRTDFCKTFYYILPKDIDNFKLLKFVDDYEVYLSSEVMRYNVIGDDTSLVNDPYLFPTNFNFQDVFYLICQQHLDNSRLFTSSTCILPHDFCSHATVLSDKGYMLPVPKVGRLLSSAVQSTRVMTDDELSMKLFNLAVLAFPYRYCYWLEDIYRNLSEVFIKIARTVLGDKLSVGLPDMLNVLPGMSNYMIFSGTYDNLLKIEKCEFLHDFDPISLDTYSITDKMLNCLQNESLDNEIARRGCLYCYNSSEYKCYDCVLDVQLCYNHIDYHCDRYKHNRLGKDELYNCYYCKTSDFHNLYIIGSAVVCNVCNDKFVHRDLELAVSTGVFIPVVYSLADKILDNIVIDSNGNLLIDNNFVRLIYQFARYRPEYYRDIIVEIARQEFLYEQKLEGFRISDTDGVNFKHFDVQFAPNLSRSQLFQIIRNGKSIAICNVNLSEKGKVCSFQSEPIKLMIGDVIMPQRAAVTISRVRMDVNATSYLSVTRSIISSKCAILDTPRVEDILIVNNAERLELLNYLVHRNYSMVEGPPGTGKSYLAIQLIDYFMRIGKSGCFLAASHEAVDGCCINAYRALGSYIYRNIPKNNDFRVNCGNVPSINNNILAYTMASVKCVFSTLQSHVENLDTYFCIIDEVGLARDSDIFSKLGQLKPVVVIFIGDAHQLAPVYNSVKLSEECVNLFSYRTMLGDSSVNEGVFHLTVQYRMDPVICDKVSNLYYNGRLTTAKNRIPKLNMVDSLRILCLRVEGKAEHREKSVVNFDEVRIVKLLLQYIRKYFKSCSVRCICSYNGTRSVLLGESNVSTIDGAQGSEFDVVIVCPSQYSKFSIDKHRLNVAMSRARELLIMLIPDDRFMEVLKMEEIYDLNMILGILKDISFNNNCYNESDIDKSSLQDIRADYKLRCNLDSMKIEVADLLHVPSSSIIGLDFEGVHFLGEYSSFMGVSEIGWSFFKGDSLGKQSVYIKPSIPYLDGSGSFTPKFKIPMRGGKPLYSIYSYEKMKRSKHTLHSAMQLFIKFIGDYCVSKPVFLCWGMQMELEIMAQYVLVDEYAVCVGCNSRNVVFKDIIGYKCLSCDVIGESLLVNIQFCDLQNYYNGQSLSKVHSNNVLCTCEGEDHDASVDANNIMCLFFRQIRCKMTPNSCCSYHNPKGYWNNLSIRKMQTSALEIYSRYYRYSELYDIGFGSGRQIYCTDVVVKGIEPYCNDESYKKAKQRDIVLLRGYYEEFKESVDYCFAFQSLHHLDLGSVNFKHCLASVFLAEDLPPKYRYYLTDSADGIYSYVGTNNIYFTTHYCFNTWVNMLDNYDVSMFDYTSHHCEGDFGVTIGLAAGVTLSCIQDNFDSELVSFGRESCFRNRYLSSLIFSMNNNLNHRLTFLNIRSKSLVNEIYLGRVYDVNADRNDKDWVHLPLYDVRKDRGSEIGVDKRPGVSKILQLFMSLKITLGVEKIKDIVIIGGAAFDGSCPMLETVEKLGYHVLQSFDPHHMKYKNRDARLLPMLFDFGNCTRCDMLISDVYIGKSDAMMGFMQNLQRTIETYNIKVLLIKLTQSFGCHDYLSKITIKYSKLQILTSSVTGHSSELWFCFSGYDLDNNYDRYLLDIHKNFMLELSSKIVFPQFITRREQQMLDRGKLSHVL